jgi:hypothetical protein
LAIRPLVVLIGRAGIYRDDGRYRADGIQAKLRIGYHAFHCHVSTGETRMSLQRAVLLILLFCQIPLEVLARIKLITLPPRERVEIQLDHPNVTLVEEERIVPLVQGTNQVDFAWANTRIDPETIVFRVLAPADGADIDIKVLSVSYPPNENALVWHVAASESGAAKVRISYVLGGLEKRFAYRALTSHDEKTLSLSQYLRVENFANEAYGDSAISVGFGEQQQNSVGLGETKKLLLHTFKDVPVRKTYTSDPQQHGYIDRPKNKLRVPMHYVLKNDAAHGLGQAALPYGKVRIFQNDGKGSSAFIGEDWGQFTPLDDEMSLYLGVAQDIVVVRSIEKSEAQKISGNLYNHEVIVKYAIENFKDEAVTLDVIERIRPLRDELRGNNGREVEWERLSGTTLGASDAARSSYETLVFHVDLPPRKADGTAETIEHKLHLLLKNEW